MSSGAQEAIFLFPTGTDIYSIKVDKGDAITGEAHTIPSSPIYGIYLDYVPTSGTVSIPGYSETSSTPGANQYQIIYSGTGAGFTLFNGINGGSSITASYTAAGDIVKAFFFNDLQQSVETIENFIGSGLGITGTFLQITGGVMVGDIVMNGADVVPQSSGSSSLGVIGTPFSSVVATSVIAQSVSDATSTAVISFGPGSGSMISNSGVIVAGSMNAEVIGGNSSITLSDNIISINAPSSQLSILVTGTDFAGNVGPSISSVYDLGSTGSRWRTIYADVIDTPGFNSRFVTRSGDSMFGDLTMSGTSSIKTNTIENGDSSNISISASSDAALSANNVIINSAYDFDVNAGNNINLGTAAQLSSIQMLMGVTIQANAASAYDIGSQTTPFRNIYADNVIGVNFSGNFVSRSGDSMSGDLVMNNFGTGTQPSIYAENISSLSGVGILNVNAGQLNVTAQNNMAFNIGSSGVQKLEIGMSQIYASDNILPTTDSLYDLGGPANYFRDLYVRNLHASGIASGTNLSNVILSDATISGVLATLAGSAIGSSGTPLGTLYVDNIITNASTGVYVVKAGDSMYGNLTMSGTANILSANSGTTNIGSPSNPFGTIYAANIISTGSNNQYVLKTGDTMIGTLFVPQIASTGTLIISGASTINTYGSQITDQAQQITLQSTAGAVIVDAQTEIQLLSNGVTKSVINSSGTDLFANIWPDVSGTLTVGTPSNPFHAIYADFIVQTSVSGTGLFVQRAGDTMSGNLNFDSGIGISLVQSGTSDIGTAANPLRSVYADNFLVGGLPILGAFVPTSGSNMTGGLIFGTGVASPIAFDGSGTASIGSASNPLGTLYVDNINSTGLDGVFVHRSGDTMTGRLNINTTLSVGTSNTISGSESVAFGDSLSAIGIQSLAQGQGSIARGNFSQAMGDNAVSSGTSSTALGDSTLAGGRGSLAIGNGSVALGEYSVAAGGSTASGDYSNAEGDGGSATGYSSHVEGGVSSAIGDDSHAEGLGTIASGTASHSEGNGTRALGGGSHAEGMNTIAGSEFSDNGHAEGDGSIASGYASHAEGSSSLAVGISSHAEGGGRAFADFSHAEVGGIASGTRSHAEGNSITYAPLSHAEGSSGTKTFGPSSHAEGESTSTYGEASHSEGAFTTTSGNQSHAEGNASITYGDNSHAEGDTTVAYGYASHSEGSFTLASGSYSHAEGDGCEAIGEASHAEGEAADAFGIASHAEGNGTKSFGNYSHAQGHTSISSGTASFAAGTSALAIHDNSTVLCDANGASSSVINELTLGFRSGIALTSGTNIVNRVSGVNSIGSVSAPLSSIYSNQYATPLAYQVITGSSATVNWNQGSSQIINFSGGISGTCAITLSNGIPGSSYVLQTINNSSGTTAVAWSGSNVIWQGGVTGVATASASGVDLFAFLYNGSKYLGSYTSNYF